MIKNLPKFPQNEIAKKKINTPKSRQCDYIFFKTKSAPATTMTRNFLSMPGQEVHSIFQHWKPLTPKLSNQFYNAARKNLSILYKFPTR